MAAKAAKPAARRKSTAEVLRARKIEAYQARIAQDEAAIQAMEAERSALAAAEIVGLPVQHKLFGPGRVVARSRGAITVDFGASQKNFIMPAAFYQGFLVTADAAANERLARYQAQGAQIETIRDSISAAHRAIGQLAKK